MRTTKSILQRAVSSPVALALAGGWLTFLGWRTASAWPRLSLDMASGDRQTEAALVGAITAHVANAVVLALGGVIIIFGVAALVARRAARGDGRRAGLDGPGFDGPWIGPQRVLLMRHAEKTGDLEDIHLSQAGQQRAERLASYLPAEYGLPDYLFAAARSKRSIRSIETLQPLAARIGAQVRHDVEDDDFEDLVAEITRDARYRDSVIVIAWHHKKIAQIAAMLGAEDGTYPDPWPETLYDVIIDLDYAAGYPPHCKQIKPPF